MKALVYNLSIPKYLTTRTLSKFLPKVFLPGLSCLSLKEIPVPNLPTEDWVLIKTEACGICGSDLSLLMGRDSFSLEPYSSFPAVLGHEAIGRIDEVGKNVTIFNKGDRVAVDNILPCKTRGIENSCEQCKSGNYSLCENFINGNLKPGPVNGYNSSVGGGFGEYFIAHKSQLFKIPENMTTENGVLADPLASALQPASTHLPNDNERIVVYGGGIIGILLINALRALGCKSTIIAITRYDFQASLAKKAGADTVIEKNLFNEIANVMDARLLKPSLGKPVYEGGAHVVFDCVGSQETIDNSLRFLKKRGKLVIVGAAGVINKVDASPIWFKEVRVTGSSMYSHINMNGARVRTYKAAIDLISSGKIATNNLVNHRFKIDYFGKAINTALNKKTYKSTKVCFIY